MRIAILLAFLSLLSFCAQARANTPYADVFAEAYAAHPRIPQGMLEAVAWTNTRIRHLVPSEMEASCAGLPARYGIMGLVADGQNWFHNNLSMVSLLGSRSAQQIMADPRDHILAYAATFEYLMVNIQGDASRPATAVPVLEALSEIPGDNLPSNFALQSHIYSVLTFLNAPAQQERFSFPAYQIDLEAVFGAENLRVLSASRVTIEGDLIQAGEARYQALPVNEATVDYPPALWDPAASCNYSSRNGTPVSAVTIHTVQGSYAGAISWFKNCAASVSAHYVVRSSDGQVTQMVAEADKAWHVGTENPYTIGIENEGYVADAAWYTNALYTSVVDLVQDIANSGYGIDLRKTWYGPPTAGLQVIGTNCYKIKGHQHYPNQTHVDPGINWDWDRFYRMLNGAPATTTFTTCSGSLTDPGGTTNNYANQERRGWLISPANSQGLTLTFSQFDTEAGYDYLYIYDGSDANGDFLGRFDGNTIPGPFTSQSGQFFLEFRADCATTRPGWTANWTCSTVTPNCDVPDGLNVTGLNPFGATLNWTAASGATSYEVRVRHSLENNWTTSAANTSGEVITGLKASSKYYWQVRTLCGASASSWAGGEFHTPAAASHTASSCSGLFRDSGGDLANYRNGENYTFTIDPPGSGTVTLSFTSFDLENNFDFLYLYDGTSTSAPLIGTYTGSNSPGTVTSTGGALTIRFLSDSWTTREGWEASWSCALSLAPNTAIGTLSEWYADDFNAGFTDTDNSNTGIDLRFYQALEFDGTAWGCNRDNGFAFETFTGGFPNWTMQSGNYYILNDALHQTDTLLTNSNIYLDVAQNAAQGAWLYTFSARLWPGVSSSNRRFGMHIFSDSPASSQRGNSYLIWFRGDNQTAEIYETVNNTLNLRASQSITLGDFVWYEFKIAYQPVSGKIEVYQEQDLILSWTDSSPITSGSHISLRTNQAHCDFENVRVWKHRNNPQPILIGPQSSNDCRYESPDSLTWAGQLHAISRDGAQNWSNIDLKNFKIDWTPPSDPSVADGLGSDIDTTFVSNELSANWTPSTDGNSGILRYEYAIGTSSGGSDVLSWTSNGTATTVTATGLSLQHNQRYYISVRAINLAELPSNEISSDGQLVWQPIASLEKVAEQYFNVYPVPTREVLHFRSEWGSEVDVSMRDAFGRLILEWREVGPGVNAMPVASLPQGAYWLEILVPDGRRVVKKVLIQR